MSFISYDDYTNLSNMELERRIYYDLFLLKQPGIHTITHQKIVVDRKCCEKELQNRGLKK